MDIINSSRLPPRPSSAHQNHFENLKNLFWLGSFFKKAQQQSQKTLAEKVMEPAKVEKMTRIDTSPEDPFEKKVIDMFLHFYHCMPKGLLPLPHTNTFAMPGRPLFSQIKMSNGLVYLAAISEVGEINWFKSLNGQVTGFNPAEHTPSEMKYLAKQKAIFTTGDLNRNYYKILLYPYHEDGKIREDDFLDIGLPKGIDLNSKKTFEIDGRLWLPHGSFEKFNQSFTLGNNTIPTGVIYPPHILKIFQKLEEFYDPQKQTLGNMIYSLFSPKETGSISPLSSTSPEVPFYNTEVINPNIQKPHSTILTKNLLQHII